MCPFFIVTCYNVTMHLMQRWSCQVFSMKWAKIALFWGALANVCKVKCKRNTLTLPS